MTNEQIVDTVINEFAQVLGGARVNANVKLQIKNAVLEKVNKVTVTDDNKVTNYKKQ